MHTFRFTLLAVLSYVSLISAIPLGDRAPPEYVPLTLS